MIGLTDSDVLYIKDSPTGELQEELRYATKDPEYAKALADELLRRAKEASTRRCKGQCGCELCAHLWEEHCEQKGDEMRDEGRNR